MGITVDMHAVNIVLTIHVTGSMVVCWVERMDKIAINVRYSSSFAIFSNPNEKMHARTNESTDNKSHNIILVLKIVKNMSYDRRIS